MADFVVMMKALLTSSGLVVSNDCPSRVKTAAKIAKYVYGSRIQVCDGVDDDVQIQAANDAITSGEIHLSEGTFTVGTAGLAFTRNIQGMGSEHTIITTSGQISFAEFARPYGLTIRTASGVTLSPAVLFKASTATVPRLLKPLMWDDFKVACGGTRGYSDDENPDQVGTGIQLNCTSTGGTYGLAQNNFGRAVICGFEYPFELYVSAVAGATAFINANNFFGLQIQKPKNGIKFTKAGTGGTEAINGNNFFGAVIQNDANMVVPVSVNGNDNKFYGLQVWDSVVTYDIVVSGDDNEFNGYFNLANDTGSRNRFNGYANKNEQRFGGDGYFLSGGLTIGAGYGLAIQNQGYTANGAIITKGWATLNNPDAALAMTLAAPATSGQELKITQIDTGTQGHTVTCAAGVTFDGTNNRATFNALYDHLELVCMSGTRWLIRLNLGVVLSAV